MNIKRANDVPAKPVEIEGAEGATIRLLIHEAEGAPTFYMRQFDLAPGGHTPHHAHPWEHELYILAGDGQVVTWDGPRDISAGDCIYVAPDEEHHFQNTSQNALTFLCLVPRSAQ